MLKDEKNQGPFLTGSSPYFIDFVIVAILETFAYFMPKDWEERVSRWDDGKWKAHRDACARYLESSD
ncbi:MAG TPA: hypothetical protein VGO47_09775, partial [Chlamydiales bacterium]|nr:hypothetical protein [Chlamydiales bacterium]